MTDKIPLFLSFWIEQYKHAHNLSGREAMNHLKSTGTLRYLEECYEPIHTQSPQWILEEIEEHVKNNLQVSLP